LRDWSNKLPSITAQALAQGESLIRTAIAAEVNSALLAAYVVAGAEVIEWVSVIDDVTTDICLELDGKRWTLPPDSEDYAAYQPIGHDIPFPGPVAHWSCRSSQIPVGQYDVAALESTLQQSTGGEI
jgi:hypothetical protein